MTPTEWCVNVCVNKGESMKTIKEMTDKELMNEYKNLYQSVYITECAGCMIWAEC